MSPPRWRCCCQMPSFERNGEEKIRRHRQLCNASVQRAAVMEKGGGCGERERKRKTVRRGCVKEKKGGERERERGVVPLEQGQIQEYLKVGVQI
nr:hypothetical protein Itr_chr03CG11290 [Ipomoea trifida]